VTGVNNPIRLGLIAEIFTSGDFFHIMVLSVHLKPNNLFEPTKGTIEKGSPTSRTSLYMILFDYYLYDILL